MEQKRRSKTSRRKTLVFRRGQRREASRREREGRRIGCSCNTRKATTKGYVDIYETRRGDTQRESARVEEIEKLRKRESEIDR